MFAALFFTLLQQDGHWRREDVLFYACEYQIILESHLRHNVMINKFLYIRPVQGIEESPPTTEMTYR